jgi:hypothetical protein
VPVVVKSNCSTIPVPAVILPNNLFVEIGCSLVNVTAASFIFAVVTALFEIVKTPVLVFVISPLAVRLFIVKYIPICVC